MKRRGSVLAMVVVLVLIIGVLAMALMDRTLSSSARAAWSRDHLALKLLAESAAEELYAQAARGANDRNSKIFERLRTLIPEQGDPALPIALTGLELQAVRKELAPLERAMGATIELAHDVSIVELGQVSDDASESSGVLRITVAATANRRFFRMTERVAIDRAFRVARSTIHHPLQLDALIVKRLPRKQEDGGGGAQDRQGGGEEKPHSYFSAHQPGARTMKTILGEEGKALDPSPDAWAAEIAQAIRFLQPREARRRAHFVTHHPRQLRMFMQGRLRRGQAVQGLLVSMSKRPLMLQFEKFQGQAVIVARGPVVIGDIQLADPKRDRLTIASGRRITVVGAKVDANLVSFGGRRKGVRFAVKTRVSGTVISQRVPKGRQLSQEDFDASEIAGVEGERYDGNRDAAPPPGTTDMAELVQYTAAFSPHAIRVNHALD